MTRLEPWDYHYTPAGKKLGTVSTSQVPFRWWHGSRAVDHSPPRSHSDLAMKLIKENWVWIAAPIILFTLVVAALVLFGPESQEPPYHLR